MGVIEPVLIFVLTLIAAASWVLVYLVLQLYLIRKREVENDRHQMLIRRMRQAAEEE